MQLAKSIIPKKINTLRPKLTSLKNWKKTLLGLLILSSAPAFSQDNSPYSRYGIGDLVPPTHISMRGMAGLSAGYSDFLTINFNNPASYSSFQTFKELKSKKIVSGRVILDVGLNFESRSLMEASPARKFVASNALFSYVQLGVPLKPGLGLSFGLRPVSRISYKIFHPERLYDPITGLPIDSAVTQYIGDGGSYLVSAGLGLRVNHNLSIGFNAGYLFGKKDYKTQRGIINDTVDYVQANYETKSTFGSLYFDFGAQYKIDLTKKVSMTWGAYGNLNQKMNASRDQIRETFFYDPNVGDTRLDSVYEERNVKGKLIYPMSFTIGFITEKPPTPKEGGWLFGIDFTQQSWNKYRFYGQKDSVKNNWMLKICGQLRPAPKKNYWSNIAYRFGLYLGPDYIKVKTKMTQLGASFGLGLPIANYNQLAQGQFSMINLAFEYGRRGNNDNILKENMFRVSLGFSLSDLWFFKKRYE